MTAKERLQATLNHQQPERIVLDFGSTAVTGIHVSTIEGLREHYGLKKRPVKVIEPYQMLGEIEQDLMDTMEIDVIGLYTRENMFGFPNQDWQSFKTFWGQEVLVPKGFITSIDDNGDLLIYPKSDNTVPASAKMPQTSFFFDTIVRQPPIDEANLNVEDNLEEFNPISEEDLNYWKTTIETVSNSDKGIIANFGGTALGDIALVPAPFLKHPKGIRDVAEWYMSTMIRPDYIHEIFDSQSTLAVENLQKIFAVVGNRIDAVFICGTDFGTQDSTFCAPETFDELWLPYYRRINDWIHENTTWKTFKHSCGAVESFMPHFIEAGFDIINPVQINATGMDAKHLKESYGKHLTFWGGGVDTQKVLPFGSPEDVRRQVLEQCEILGRDGGFVFNTVHNIQANVPVANIVAMIEALKEIR